MRIEWDERKNQRNIRRHGLSFAEVKEIFAGPMITATDDREDYGEDRWLAIGLLRHRIVVPVYTERGEDTIRPISLRKALSHERKRYEEEIRNRLGASGLAYR